LSRRGAKTKLIGGNRALRQSPHSCSVVIDDLALTNEEADVDHQEIGPGMSREEACSRCPPALYGPHLTKMKKDV